MSLINARKERKALGSRVKQPPSLLRLLVMLVLVIGLIVWLSRVN